MLVIIMSREIFTGRALVNCTYRSNSLKIIKPSLQPQHQQNLQSPVMKGVFSKSTPQARVTAWKGRLSWNVMQVWSATAVYLQTRIASQAKKGGAPLFHMHILTLSVPGTLRWQQ